MTIAGIVECHRVLRALWPDTPVTEDTVKAWSYAFDDCTDAQVKAAVAAYIKRGRFWPKPAELRELLAEAAISLVPETAWAVVLKEVRRVGFRPMATMVNGVLTDPPRRQFDDPLIAEAVEATGWALICTGDPAEARKAFTWSLKAIVDRERKAAMLGSSAAGLAMRPDGMTALVEEVA